MAFVYLFDPGVVLFQMSWENLGAKVTYIKMESSSGWPHLLNFGELWGPKPLGQAFLGPDWTVPVPHDILYMHWHQWLVCLFPWHWYLLPTPSGVFVPWSTQTQAWMHRINLNSLCIVHRLRLRKITGSVKQHHTNCVATFLLRTKHLGSDCRLTYRWRSVGLILVRKFAYRLTAVGFV